MSKEIRLSVIVVTWEEKHEVIRCIESLLSHLDNDLDEIIVIDNGSKDGTESALCSSFADKITYLNVGENIGVGPARNRGISLAKGKYIMMLDNDTRLLSHDPGTIIEQIFQQNNVGIVGFKLIHSDGTIQRSARRFPKLLQPFASRLKGLSSVSWFAQLQRDHLMEDTDFDNFSGIMAVDYLIGANQVFSKQFVEWVGSYDNNMFYGAEDCEICLRATKAGFTNYYSTHITIEHRYTRRSTTSKRMLICHTYSFLYMFLKHRRIWSLKC